MVYTVLRQGTVVHPRGLETMELLASDWVIDHPMSIELAAGDRKFAHWIGVLEGLQFLGQFSVPEMFTDRLSRWGDYEDMGILHGSYGARAHGLLADVVSTLTKDPSSRQAVVTLFDATRDLDRSKKDVPCTISLQFFLRASDPAFMPRLDMIVSMRSNDAWIGTPYDLQQFAIVQAGIAQALRVFPGRYWHRAGSLHLYQKDWLKAEGILAHGDVQTPEFAWPLFSCEPEWVFARARDLALGKAEPRTDFEKWAHVQLYPQQSRP